MSTVFTKIIRGEIPSWKVAENEEFYAFLDIHPIAEGHTLVVPKRETDYFFDLSDLQLHGLISFSRRIAKTIDKTLKPIRTGVIVQGLEVPHAHLHLVPLYTHSQSMALGHSIDVSRERMEELSKIMSKELA
ncbi:MAG: HIT family protein [Balneolaceae bacterium]